MTDITSRAPQDAALVSAVREAVEARFPTTLQTLTDLGALDEELRPTALGRRLAAIPAEPRLAREDT